MLVKEDTICWFCKNACGGCSWSRDFKPVNGWVATETFLSTEKEVSYIVHECPLYKLDKKILTPKEISGILNMTERNFYRLPKIKVLSKLINKGYNVVLDSSDRFILTQQ